MDKTGKVVNKLKLTFLTAAIFAFYASTQAQNSDTATAEAITLPVAFYDKTQHEAIATTVEFMGEEQDAYELVLPKRAQGKLQTGKAYYIPSAMGDRSIFLLDNATLYPNVSLIKSKDETGVVLQLKGRGTIHSNGDVIYVHGPLYIVGDDDGKGYLGMSTRRNAITAGGSIGVSNAELYTMTSNIAIAASPIANKEPELTLDRVKLLLQSSKGVFAGFHRLELIGCGPESEHYNGQSVVFSPEMQSITVDGNIAKKLYFTTTDYSPVEGATNTVLSKDGDDEPNE